MNYLTKFIFLILCVFSFFITDTKALEKIDIYFFYGLGCPHCGAEADVLDEIEKEYDNISIHRYEVSYDRNNYQRMLSEANRLGITVSGVPFTVIKDKYFIGFSSSYTKSALKNAIDYYSDNKKTTSPPEEKKEEKEDEGYTFDIPFIGSIETSSLSLPVVTILMGMLDGFNPCAMWILLFLISILVGMKDRKRMWVLGLTFITTSSFVYFLFMAAWLNLALFAGSLIWVRTIIALVALVGGVINLRSFLNSKDGGCKIVNNEKREKIFNRIKKFTSEKKLIFAFGGIILLAFSVNLIELLCSAGLPVIYTQILVLNEVSTVQYYLYLLLYILVFMVDDMIVFIIAMITLQVTGISTKYSKISNLIGGLLMIIIGLLLIFNPSLLMFD